MSILEDRGCSVYVSMLEDRGCGMYVSMLEDRGCGVYVYVWWWCSLCLVASHCLLVASKVASSPHNAISSKLVLPFTVFLVYHLNVFSSQIPALSALFLSFSFCDSRARADFLSAFTVKIKAVQHNSICSPEASLPAACWVGTLLLWCLAHRIVTGSEGSWMSPTNIAHWGGGGGVVQSTILRIPYILTALSRYWSVWTPGRKWFSGWGVFVIERRECDPVHCASPFSCSCGRPACFHVAFGNFM